MAAATERPVAPALYDGPAPCHEVIIKAPDLTRWPIPTHSPLDAGPFITAGVVIAHDPETGATTCPTPACRSTGPTAPVSA
jgi:gallate decarboxylase subunit C